MTHNELESISRRFKKTLFFFLYILMFSVMVFLQLDNQEVIFILKIIRQQNLLNQLDYLWREGNLIQRCKLQNV